MQQLPPALTLLARQTRMINASEGLRLEVRSGCLWLTRPGDSVDRFLVAGTSIELHENHVVIQSDLQPGTSSLVTAHYILVPLTEIETSRKIDRTNRSALNSAAVVCLRA